MYDSSFQAKVFPVLKTAFDTYLSGVFDGRLYMGVPPSNPTFPCGVFQSQDRGGVNADKINQNGWEGLITFRSIDISASTADANLIALCNLLPTMVLASGYSMTFRASHPQWFPIEKKDGVSVYTSGLIVEFNVYKD